MLLFAATTDYAIIYSQMHIRNS